MNQELHAVLGVQGSSELEVVLTAEVKSLCQKKLRAHETAPHPDRLARPFAPRAPAWGAGTVTFKGTSSLTTYLDTETR